MLSSVNNKKKITLCWVGYRAETRWEQAGRKLRVPEYEDAKRRLFRRSIDTRGGGEF